MAPRLLLVTGLSGLLGSNVARIAKDYDYEIVGTYQRHAVDISGVRSVQLDLAQPKQGATLVERLCPNAVVHTAAISRPDECVQDPQRCQLVNVDSTRLLARAAAKAGARFLFLSSDLVYGNRTGEISESTPVEAVGVYAASKLEAEQAALQETAGAAFIARTSLIYGWGTGASISTFEEWLAALRGGQRIRAFTDQRRCPTFVDDLAEVLLTASEKGLGGVFNVAGPEFLSRYEFACAMAEEFNLDESLIEPFSIDAFGYSDPRPKELNLSIAKLRAAAGYAPLGVREALGQLHQREGCR